MVHRFYILHSYAHPENFKKRYARPAPLIPKSMSSLLALFLIDEGLTQNRFEEEVFQILWCSGFISSLRVLMVILRNEAIFLLFLSIP